MKDPRSHNSSFGTHEARRSNTICLKLKHRREQLPSQNRCREDEDELTSPWTFRRYRDGDEQSITELLNLSFGTWGSLEHWKWKYAKNPEGPATIWLAEYGNRIIGHCSIIPMKMKIRNSYIIGATFTDVAAHPDHQGHGIVSPIVNSAFLDAGQNRISITYGFADINLPTYKRWGPIGHICFVTHMTKVLNWEPFLTRYIHSKSLLRPVAYTLQKMRRTRSPRRSIRIEMSNRFDERINAFWGQISGDFEILVRRDEQYLNWRYTGDPDKKYTIYLALEDDKIVGYCVLTDEERQGVKLGHVVDVLGFQHTPDILLCLIDTAVEYFEQRGFHGITCMMSARHPYKPLFRRAGFMPQVRRRNLAMQAAVNFPGSPIDHKQIYQQGLLLSQSPILKEEANWFIMEGDRL
jgi:GNAT superfamily N-acetyltransferase